MFARRKSVLIPGVSRTVGLCVMPWECFQVTGSADGRIPGQMPEHSMWDSCCSEVSGCHSSTGLYFCSFLFLESLVDPGVSGTAQGRERGSPGPMCPSCSPLAEQEGHFLETPPKKTHLLTGLCPQQWVRNRGFREVRRCFCQGVRLG